ncbi:MAG: c-type cytochrome domain-containing protein [Chitinophagaceae bacterium]
MQRWKNILFNIILCLNCLLVLFVLAGDRLQVPLWLQVMGRMHPLVLHFPIVLLVLYICWSLVVQAKTSGVFTGPEDEIGKWLLLITAFTAALTAVMGFLLSKEEGYNPQALWWHKWGGVAIALFSFFWYAFRNSIHRRRFMPQLAAILSLILIVFTGHQGSNITHGENYLLAPVTPEKIKPVVALEDAVVYADMVKPIIETKCMSCHSSKKAKGELVMETVALLMKGGKHGALWTNGQPETSLLMQRIHLPETEKKHMPPAGKPQLDDEETAIFLQWIKSGASFKQKVNELPATDSLRMLANHLFGSSTEAVYDFPAADDNNIEKLTNTNRLVQPLALHSPALAVNFYNRQNYTTAALKELLALKTQVVSMDMAYMPVKEEDIKVMAQFTNLRKLNLNFSTVPGKSLSGLSTLPFLKHLSLSGTAVTRQDVQMLAAFPALEAVFLWNAPVTTADMDIIRKTNPKISFETGFMNDSLMLKLTPPLLETETRIIGAAPLALELKHYIKGVTIRYTTDGTMPDSVHAAIYKNDVLINRNTVFKAKAFKKGWLGSDSIVVTFYKNTYTADSIRSLTPLDSVYKGTAGAQTLVNMEKGEANLRNGKWLGFRSNKMEMLLHYAKPVMVSSVTLSTAIEIGGYIMPPAVIEIWGGSNEKKLVRLGRMVPQQPDSMRSAYMQGFDCNFKTTLVNFIKVVAVPVAKLPAWHPSKGQKGWFFTDEIFVN